tara:strand:- start:5207 stop:6547 length:1341 start_codon:yes stop_codon:yes gene_type:complete
MGNYFQPQVWGHKVFGGLRESVDKYKQSQREAKADERYQQQLAWQQKVQGWKELDYEREETKRNRQKFSNLLLNEVSSRFLSDSWEDRETPDGETISVYKGGEIPDSRQLLKQYVDGMKIEGYEVNPQEMLAIQQYIQGTRDNYIEDATKKLRAKISKWDIDNKGKHGSDNWVPFDDNLEEERKKYIEAIGGNELYHQLVGEEGEGYATQKTGGITPDDLNDSSFSIPTEVAVGGAIGTTYGTKAAMNQYKNALEKFDTEFKSDVLNKRDGGIDWKEFKKKYGVSKADAKGKSSKEILKMAKSAGWKGTWFNKLSHKFPTSYSILKTASPEIGQKADEILGTGDVMQTAGTAAVLHETKKRAKAVSVILNQKLKTVTAKKGFLAYLKKKLPTVIAKQGTAALARHGAAAGTGIGASPWVQVPLLLADAGYSYYAIMDLIKEYKKEG